MRKRPIILYWALSILSVILLPVLIVLIFFLYKFKSDSVLLGIFSAWISVVSGLLFSGVISLLVQIINDDANEKEILNKKDLIRKREINILSRQMSMFLSFYHDNESYLMQNYKIKDSCVNNNLDSNIIRDNMQILSKAYKKANKQNKTFMENYLLISDNIRNEYNKVIELVNQKRVEFENINIDMNFQIFSQGELEVMNLIPLFTKSYNDNLYISMKNIIKIIDTFNLEINFDDSKWVSVIATLLVDDFELVSKKQK